MHNEEFAIGPFFFFCYFLAWSRSWYLDCSCFCDFGNVGFSLFVESVPGSHTLKMIDMDEVGCINC